MKKRKMIELVVITLLIIISTPLLGQEPLSKTPNNKDEFRYPGEWEPMEAIWIQPNSKSFLAGPNVERGMLDCIKELTNFVKVNIRVFKNDTILQQTKTRLINYGIDMSKVNFIKNFPDTARGGTSRDTGPAFLINDNKEIMAVDFDYISMFGPPNKRTALTDKKDRDWANFLNIPVRKAKVGSEGGARESNGKGTLMLVEKLELKRNFHLGRKEIEAEFKKGLGVSKIIWLRKGLIEDETGSYGTIWRDLYPIGAGGHIDLFCRFAGANTILLSEVKKEETKNNLVAAINYEILEENYRILKNSTDQDGKPFNIIRIPVGPFMTAKHVLTEENKYILDIVNGSKVGDTFHYILGTSYLNFIIANGVVITSKYFKEGRSQEFKVRDEKAKLALQKAFPKHKIVQIDIEGYNHDGAGFHCVTLNQPKAN
jgi:agmatine deiminase